MNTNVLKKCLEELSKPTPNIDKVIGMLETMIEMSGVQFPNLVSQATNLQFTPSLNSYGKVDEEEGSGLVAAYLGGAPAQLQ